jgi:outer membrane receptor protein involved in Fe transport
VFGPAGPYVSLPVTYANLLSADTKGLEIDAHWTPVPWWRLDGGYTAFQFTPHLGPSSHDPRAALEDGDAPGQQWLLHSGLSIGRRAEADVALFRVGALNAMGIRPYTRADARFEWRLTGALSAAAVGQNLFDESHAEFNGADANAIATTVPRSVRLQLTLRLSKP